MSDDKILRGEPEVQATEGAGSSPSRTDELDLNAPFNPLSSPNRNQGSRDFSINFDPLALDEESHILDGFQSTGDDLLDRFFDHERHQDVREQKVEYEVETQKGTRRREEEA